MVFVSYCTGDLHLGERDTTYTNEDVRGKRQFEIKHRGQINAMAALQWVYANFPAPVEVFVTGTSAGGYATPFRLLNHAASSVEGLAGSERRQVLRRLWTMYAAVGRLRQAEEAIEAARAHGPGDFVYALKLIPTWRGQSCSSSAAT